MMKHPDKSLELFEFNLGKVFDLFCHRDSSRICGSCELCQLKKNFVHVREWFDRASDISQRRFLVGLVERLKSVDLVRSVVRILNPANSKDLAYVFSRSFPSLEMDRPTISDNRALDGDKLNKAIEKTWNWFQTRSYWTKANFLLALFQICKLHLLHTVGLQSFALLQFYEKNEIGQDLRDDLEASSIASSHYTVSPENYPDVFSSLFDYKVLSRSDDDYQAEQTSSGTINMTGCVGNQATDEISHRNVLQLLKGNVGSDELSDFKDFIRYLPVHLSKYILRLLDQTSLSNCRHVSRLWQTLGQEVSRESRFRHNMKKDIELMQGASAEVCNPCYANDVTVAVPNIVSNSWDIMEAGNASGGSTYPAENKPLFADAYAGYSTHKIIMEERNIYCGPYNVMKVTDSSDPSRVVHMDGERLIAVGGGDKRIHLISTESRQPLEPVISGHAGSVKCVLINEKQGFVISGSFDTSIRKWSLLTKKCLKIYRGHSETVICLGLSGSLLASGSIDKTCKVWNVETGKCLKSFKHKTSVTSVAISDDLCISGSSDAQVKVWHLSSGSLIKKLAGHQKSITAIVFDRWHIVTSALDNYAFVWSSLGNYTKCLTALHHPNDVLCLVFKYLRVVTGCADGKIRIWNVVTGQCLRILRGNSHSDPISQLTATDNRILVNTKSCLLMMSFEPLEYDYELCDDKMPSALQKPLRSLSKAQFQPRSYIRAQRMILSGATNPKIIRHNDLDSIRPTTHSSSVEAKSFHLEKSRKNQVSSKNALYVYDCPSPMSRECTSKELSGNGLEVTKAKGIVREAASSDHCDTVVENKVNRRRTSWAFEYGVISDHKHMSLAETRSLLKSQIRAKGETRPPDFVARTVTVIQASMKPDEDDDNLEVNRRERELMKMKQSNRPLSSPSRIDPRSKVAVAQLKLERFRTDAETSNSDEMICSATEMKQSNSAIHSDRTKTGLELLRHRSKSNLNNSGVASSKISLVRPSTSTVVRPTDLLDSLHLRPKSCLSRINNRQNITSSSDHFALVPMLMYPKEVTNRIDELREHRLVVSAKPRDSSPINGDGRWSKRSTEMVSPYSDPLRNRIDLQLLTHQQLLDQMQKDKLLHEECEAKKRLENEKRRKAAWLQGIKSTSF